MKWAALQLIGTHADSPECQGWQSHARGPPDAVVHRSGATLTQGSSASSGGSTIPVLVSRPDFYVDFNATDGILGSGINT